MQGGFVALTLTVIDGNSKSLFDKLKCCVGSNLLWVNSAVDIPAGSEKYYQQHACCGTELFLLSLCDHFCKQHSQDIMPWIHSP